MPTDKINEVRIMVSSISDISKSAIQYSENIQKLLINRENRSVKAFQSISETVNTVESIDINNLT